MRQFSKEVDNLFSFFANVTGHEVSIDKLVASMYSELDIREQYEAFECDDQIFNNLPYAIAKAMNSGRQEDKDSIIKLLFTAARKYLDEEIDEHLEHEHHLIKDNLNFNNNLLYGEWHESSQQYVPF